MSATVAAFAAKLAGTLDGDGAAVTVLTGCCGSGRTSVLMKVRDLVGPRGCQYVDVEGVATTPERFLGALVGESPFRGGPHTSPTQVKGPREAFDASLAFLSSACTSEGTPATFLLDEVLGLRTFESFPGLRRAVPDLVSALASSPNRFVLATRFCARAARLAAEANGRFVLQRLPNLTVSDVSAVLASLPPRAGAFDSIDDLARTVHALTDGRPHYVQAMLAQMAGMADHGGADPVGALAALLAPSGALAGRCRFSYELRLHRARGYGALKAILSVLADEEPLTLTGIANRLARTPGSAKDYLGWLEDVDPVVADRKRYRISDPVLRLWVRLHARALPPCDEVVVREVQRYTMLRLAAAARAESAAEMAAAPPADRGPHDASLREADLLEPALARPRSSGIVEFD